MEPTKGPHFVAAPVRPPQRAVPNPASASRSRVLTSVELSPRWNRRGLSSLVALIALGVLADGCTGHRQPTTTPNGTVVQRGEASWYGSKFNGKRTANGERYDMRALTAAHPSLPFGTLVRVTNLDNGHQVVVRINDRGPFAHGRIIDVSYAAARELDLVGPGTANVELAVVNADEALPERVVPLHPVTAIIADKNATTPAPSAALSEALREVNAPAPTAAPAVPQATPLATPGDITLTFTPLPAPPAVDPEALPTPTVAVASALASSPAPRTARPIGHLRFTVQVGAFSEAERAAALRDELVVRYPETVVHSDGTWNRVQIGLFAERAGAEDLCRELVAQGISSLVVTAPAE
jgi:rare lipoprotein A